MRNLGSSACLLVLLLAPAGFAQTISDARRDANGFLVHQVASEFQAGTTEIRVLLPDRLVPGQRYPVLFVLPVEANHENRYGDGLLEIKKHDLHNKFGVICVALTFSHLPWYADHPTDAKIRQESYLLQVVLPFVARQYPVRTEASGRWLLGFSKSGYGAFSLLLRHPQTFGKAAAWDAPLEMTRPDRFGMGPIYGTQDNFEKYQLTRLIEANRLKGEPRLCLLGTCNFREHHVAFHDRLDRLKIAHSYRDEHRSPHTWHSGWVADGIAWLAGHR